MGPGSSGIQDLEKIMLNLGWFRVTLYSSQRAAETLRSNDLVRLHENCPHTRSYVVYCLPQPTFGPPRNGHASLPTQASGVD